MRTLWLAEAKQRDEAIERWTAGALVHELASEQQRRRLANASVGAGAVALRNKVPLRPPPVVLNAGTCEQLVAKYFPDDTAWALRIARRESHCTAGAVNNEGCDTSGRTNSHALGVFQMCWPLHQPSFNAAGCSAPLELDCGIRAARALYDANGRGPWGG